MFASAMAVTATSPIHLVRTRMQSNSLQAFDKRYSGPMDVLKRTY